MKRAPDIERLLDRDRRLKVWPARPGPRAVALQFLASKSDAGRDYTERQVNDVLQAWHAFGDAALLRRELCDRGLLLRDARGTRYRKAATAVRERSAPLT